MTIRDKVTTAGGNRGFRMTRSKIAKEPKTGYGKVISVARERLLQKLGYDPGKNTVASHRTDGSHFGKMNSKDQDAYWATRGRNTAESNMNREGGLSASEKLKLKTYKTPKMERKKLSELFNERRRKSRQA